LTIVSKNKVLALFGPTACGKTALLERLFAGRDRIFNQEISIISADSIQVYRGLDIGSAKPDIGFLSAVPHHLINIRDPHENFSLGDFVELADRIVRALEVYRSSGKPLSSFTLPVEPRSTWDVVPIAIDRPREELYQRINLRVQHMFTAGLPAEFEALLQSGCRSETPAMKGIGYSEFFASYPDNLSVIERLKAIQEAVALHTRHYAKRQLTFMRALPNVHWFSAEAFEEIAAFISRLFA